MRASIAIATTLVACTGGPTGAGHATATPTPTATPTAPIANAKPPPRPLPPGCAPKPADPGYAPWDRGYSSDCIGVVRAVDEGYVVLTTSKLAAYDRDAHPRWEATLDRPGPDGRKCGYPSGLAIDREGRVAVSCGYSLSSFAADGSFRWQVWPGGNHAITPPLVDTAGTIYVGVEGTVYAVAPDGTTRWEAATGWNRYFGAIAPTARGELIIYTMMAALHSEDGPSGGHFYYEEVPPALIVIERARGTIVSTTVTDTRPDPWPAWTDVTGEGGGRIP